jgi:DNA-binding NarL/FixJ family response regulator
VIVADDHRDMLRALVHFLGGKFDIVGAVHDGKALIDAAVSLIPDVIVSDISMPGLSGLQAMKELNARGYTIPFIFVTAEPALMDQGHLSFIDKLDVHAELIPAIETVAVGRQYIPIKARFRTLQV